MKENVSGCFFLNTVYYQYRLRLCCLFSYYRCNML